MTQRIVVHEGLLAHGRGEAFDYLLGEQTNPPAKQATRAAAAHLLTAKNPVISVNGNTAALVPREISRLASAIPAKVEVNLFHRTDEREVIIASRLRRNGVRLVLGVGPRASYRIPGISSRRAKVDPSGIEASDVVLVPLEDGDRVSALRSRGKTIIAIDLNPLSRTSRAASVTIVDNIVRALPALVAQVRAFKRIPRPELEGIMARFDNLENLAETTREIVQYLQGWMGS